MQDYGRGGDEQRASSARATLSGAQGAAACAEKRRRQLPEQIETQQHLSSDLLKLLITLEERLEPVLLAVPERDKKNEIYPVKPPLVQAIFEHNVVIGECAVRVRSMLERLEL